MEAQTVFCELPTIWACYFHVSLGRQLWVSALAWREDEEGLCSHGNCGLAGCPVVSGKMWAGEGSAWALLHWSMFWPIGGASTCCIALLVDCCVSRRQGWKQGAQCLFFSLCLFLSCFFPQFHITESLEIQLFHQLFAVEKAEGMSNEEQLKDFGFV